MKTLKNLFIFSNLIGFFMIVLAENDQIVKNFTNLKERSKRQGFFFPFQPNYGNHLNPNFQRRRFRGGGGGGGRIVAQNQAGFSNAAATNHLNNGINRNFQNVFYDGFGVPQYGFTNNNFQQYPNQAYYDNNYNGFFFGNQGVPVQNFNNQYPNGERRRLERNRSPVQGPVYPPIGLDHFSGFGPNGRGVYGERFRRISQIKYEEYMNRIYGDDTYDENSGILSADDLNGRVIAKPGEFPHIAVIGIRTAFGPKNVHWKCGGTLIDIKFVLTAAHCIDFGGEPPNWIKLGDVNLSVKEDTVATQIFRIANIYPHPKYKNNLNYYDIALIELVRPAVFTKHVRPAQLWAENEIPANKAFAVGYGATKFGKTPTNVLTFFNLTVIDNKECNKKLPRTAETPSGILNDQICAIDYEQHRDTCQGDSGGPLELIFPGRRRARYYIIGITSFGSICSGTTPSVYTKVFSYLDWIERIVWPEASQQQLQQQQQQLGFNNFGKK